MQGWPVTSDDVLNNQQAALDARRRRVLFRTLALSSAFAVAACSNPFKKSEPPPPPPPKPTTLSGSVKAAADLNPSVSQRPSPLIVRMYELRSAAAFNQADFMALFQSEQSILGPELVVREEFTMVPGETRPISTKTLNAETRFIAVFAAYRNLERARWRAVVAIKPGQAQVLTIRADALTVSAEITP